MQLDQWWPVVADKQWTWRQALVAGAAYRGAFNAGLGQEKAAVLAEIAGYKNLYEGIIYPIEVEKRFAAFLRAQGTETL
jgi:hypothetical protein